MRKLIDLLRMSLFNLGRKKSRSLMTVMGIAIGVASVVLIASIGDIGKAAITSEIESLGVGGLMISSNRKLPGTQLADEQLDTIRASGTVDSAIPIVLEYTKTYMRELMMDAAVWGIDYGANQVFHLNSLYGRLITKNDVTARRNICVVDQNIAQAFYKRDNIVGKTVTVQFASGYQELEIVGVVSSGGNLLQGLIGEIIPCFVYMPYTTLQDLSGKDSFDQIAVRVKPGVDGDVAGVQIVSALSNASGVQGGFKADNMLSQKAKLDSVLNIITIVLSAIAGVSLIVAGLSIMTVMLVSVNERTREIGIKKSIGASRRSILFEFLIEAFAISLIGSLAGTVVGVLLIIIGCIPFGIAITLNVGTIVFCIFFSIFVGVVFGVYPATLASKMRPVDALRFE
ncbi:MAG: ABC transporter permease [Oscillospiraceae bacterium]|nr:ABC transporter permease [Oscillospiraceae bacterium]